MHATIPANYWRALMRLAHSEGYSLRPAIQWAQVETDGTIVATDGWRLIQIKTTHDLPATLRLRTPIPNRKVTKVRIADETAEFYSSGGKLLSTHELETEGGGKLPTMPAFPEWRQHIGETGSEATSGLRLNPSLIADMQHDLCLDHMAVELRHTKPTKESSKEDELRPIHITFLADDTINFWLMPCR